MANDYVMEYSIQESSFCYIGTDGYAFGIQWCLGNWGSSNYQTDYYTTEDLALLPSNYFETTRCVLLGVCSAGTGGSERPDNFVNVLQSKGVQTVVGFKERVGYTYDENGNISDEYGEPLWSKNFIRALGEGKTVTQAKDAAMDAIKKVHIPGNYWGLDSWYIAGNANQIVKH